MKEVNNMKHFDDSHYRLGRVTNMDARSNNARIELLESEINEIERNMAVGKYSDEILPEMICTMNTLKQQLTEQLHIKDILLEEKKKLNDDSHKSHNPSPIGSGFNILNALITAVKDNYYTGQTTQHNAENKIIHIKDKWVRSTKDCKDGFIQYTLSNGVTIQIPTYIPHQTVQYIRNECERVCRNNKIPIQAFQYGYGTYLKIMEGSNPIGREDAKECDFTMVSISYKILKNNEIYIRPVYRFNILMNGKTMYLSVAIHKNNASDVNWLTSLPRKKVGFK